MLAAAGGILQPELGLALYQRFLFLQFQGPRSIGGRILASVKRLWEPRFRYPLLAAISVGCLNVYIFKFVMCPVSQLSLIEDDVVQNEDLFDEIGYQYLWAVAGCFFRAVLCPALTQVPNTIHGPPPYNRLALPAPDPSRAAVRAFTHSRTAILLPQEDSNAPAEFPVINPWVLDNNPSQILRQMASWDGSAFRIRYLESPGVDAKGLERDFVTRLLSGLVRKGTIPQMELGKENSPFLAHCNFVSGSDGAVMPLMAAKEANENDKIRCFTALGRLMAICLRDNLTIGFIF